MRPDGAKKLFRWRTLCNYEIGFSPLDHYHGDKIALQFSYLGNTFAAITLAKDQRVNNRDVSTLSFDHRVNNNPGKFSLLYPMKAYIALKQFKFYNYRPSYFSFSVRLIKYQREQGETPEMVKEKFKKLED